MDDFKDAYAAKPIRTLEVIALSLDFEKPFVPRLSDLLSFIVVYHKSAIFTHFFRLGFVNAYTASTLDSQTEVKCGIKSQVER